MRFREHQRTARQATVHLLLMFVLLLAALVLAVNAVLALALKLTVPILSSYPTYFFETNTAVVLLFVLGGCWVENLRLRDGGAAVARLAGGREVQLSGGGDLARLERRFANTVQEMALASGYDGVPAAWVLARDDAINAFAAGWGSDDAVVAVTRGALERLTRAELQGVVAHEFSHLLHGDTRLNMRLIGLVWGLQMIWGLGRSLWTPDELGRRRAGALLGLGLMAVGSLGWAAGRLLQAAVSRQREFLADASAVKYTRTVDGLGGALRKIADQQHSGQAALHSADDAHGATLAHLLLSHHGAGAGWQALWHTHPPLSERLRRLYGDAVLPEAALLLPVDANESDASADAGLARVAPGQAGADASERRGPFATDAQTAPESHRHDPHQVPAWFGAQARETEALARIERWHGPGEWQSAMLALALDCDIADTNTAADAEQGWQAWRAATADLRVAPSIPPEVRALSPAARRRALVMLMASAEQLEPAQRRSWRRTLMQRWRQLPSTPRTRWRALALSLLLARRVEPPPRAASGTDLVRHAPAAHAATRQLAPVLGLGPAATQAWLHAAVQSLTHSGAPARSSPGAGLAPASAEREGLLALRVRRLSAMQRPLLLRAWLQAAQQTGVTDHPSLAEALHLACLWLDVPVPESLGDPPVSTHPASRDERRLS